MNRVLGPLAALVAAMTALSACTGSAAVDQNANSYKFTQSTKIGTVIPAGDRKQAGNFSGELLGGGRTSLAAIKGKVVVVNFWASWCAPCQTETPQFDLLYRQIKSRGVSFVGIDMKDDKGSGQTFVRNHHISFPTIFDEAGRAQLQLGNILAAGPPFTLLIDQHRKVAAVYVGRQADADLERALNALLAEG